MKKFKKVVSMVTAGALLFSLAACSSSTATTTTEEAVAEATEVVADDGAVVIGASWQDLSNEYIKLLADETEAYCDDLGVELISNDGVGNPETQLSQVETFIIQGVDAIILNPYDADGCIPAAVAAANAGIPCIVVCSVLTDMSSVTSFVGSNDFNAGAMEAQLVVDTIGGSGNVVILRGPNGHSAEINRSAGIYSVLDENPDVTVLYDQTANWDRAEAMSLLENWIQTGVQIDGVIAENDEMAVGAFNALEAAGMSDTPVVGVDGIADAYLSISQGNMLATFLQDAQGQGQTAVDVALKAISGEEVEADYDIPFTLVDASNVDEYL